jgi:spore coat protein U-like protein
VSKHVAPVVAAVLLALAGTAQAAQKSATFQVSATVSKNCVISAAALNLGTFEGTNDLTGSSDISVRCTSGTPFDVNLSTGGSGSYAERQLSNGTSTLVYNLYTESDYTTVWGDGATGGTGRKGGTGEGMAAASVQELTVHGRLLASQNDGALEAGDYFDTITATVVY